MVSSGSVVGDAQNVASVFSNYTSLVSELSSSWNGISHDNLVSKADEFASQFQEAITSQMTSFAEAIELYYQYLQEKEYLKTAEYNYNTAVAYNDVQNANAFVEQINEKNVSTVRLKQQIEQLLASVASVKLEATPIKSSAASADFVNYYQYNYNQPYSEGTIKTDGCGPTSMAMVLTNLTGKEVTPVEMAAKGNGRYTCSKGTYWSFFGDMAKEYGVNCTQMEPSSANIINNLNDGKTLILSMRKGHFTQSGHFIVVRGMDENGQLIVSDPASEKRSNQTWDVNLVAGESCQIWALSE